MATLVGAAHVAFLALIVIPAAVAAFTVVVPALVAPIVAVPLGAIAFIVVPVTVNTLVLLEEYVTDPSVPLPLAELEAAVIVLLYSTSWFAVGVVIVNALVYFCTVTVTLTVPCFTVEVLALVTAITTVLSASSFAANTPAVKLVPPKVLPWVLSVVILPDKEPPLLFLVKFANVEIVLTYTVVLLALAANVLLAFCTVIVISPDPDS